MVAFDRAPERERHACFIKICTRNITGCDQLGLLAGKQGRIHGQHMSLAGADCRMGSDNLKTRISTVWKTWHGPTDRQTDRPTDGRTHPLKETLVA